MIFDILTWTESSLYILNYSPSRSLFIPLSLSLSLSFQHKIKYHNMIIVYIITILFYSIYFQGNYILINFKISGASCSKVKSFRFRILVLYKSTREAGVSDNIQGILIYKLCNFINKYLVAPRGRNIMRENSFKLNISSI